MITWHTKTSILKRSPRDQVSLRSLAVGSVAVGTDANGFYYAVYYSKLGSKGRFKIMSYSRDLKPCGLVPLHNFIKT